ncbi:MAG: NAD(P)/FAD-dependent oxidoreductase [Dehalococcoidia bacterium]
MESYDFVIVGGGHNGLSTAAYLAKSGYSVAVCEARLEIGGCMDFSEVRAGCVIQPHALVSYANASPGMEHLDLWKYGLRFAPYKGPFMLVNSDDKAIIGIDAQNPAMNRRALEIMKKWSPNDVGFWEAMLNILFPNLKEVLRSIYWTPPWPLDLEYKPEDLPWYQELNKIMPNMFGREWLEYSLLEIIDELLENDNMKGFMLMQTYYQGVTPHWRGQAIPSLGSNLLFQYSGGMFVGGMHMYAHAIARSAMAHGARILSNSPAEEIIVRNNRAVGVRLADNAQYKEKLLMANKAVISAVDTQQTFLRLLRPDHLDRSFLQRVADIDMRSGAIDYTHCISKDYPRLKGEAGKLMASFDTQPAAYLYPMDGTQPYWDYIRDVEGLRITGKFGPMKASAGYINMASSDSTVVPKGYTILGGFQTNLPPPEYHAGGPDAVSFEKKVEYNNMIKEMLCQMAPNMRDNIVYFNSNTPLESEFRNAGLAGASWCGPAATKDQWWSNRPLPELSRYRAPIEGLYLGHQSQYPGGLCLMAVAYNLMHILIDDGLVEPKSWWYPSPWHVKDGDTKIPRMK